MPVLCTHAPILKLETSLKLKKKITEPANYSDTDERKTERSTKATITWKQFVESMSPSSGREITICSQLTVVFPSIIT